MRTAIRALQIAMTVVALVVLSLLSTVVMHEMGVDRSVLRVLVNTVMFVCTSAVFVAILVGLFFLWRAPLP